MTKRNIKIGFEFSLDGKNVYKVSQMIDQKNKFPRFLAAWVGDFSEREMTTYWGFIRHGDFRLDQALFELVDGRISKVHDATGVIGLPDSSDEYKEAVLK